MNVRKKSQVQIMSACKLVFQIPQLVNVCYESGFIQNRTCLFSIIFLYMFDQYYKHELTSRAFPSTK